ncbi:hypothetical protein BGY98DRAFT_1190947 [Russula aff. rugulosa BPL654]|nr:hypothetical protein BGY98DRAFT_1190947 [Russula aff. rugulosa BPL654]
MMSTSSDSWKQACFDVVPRRRDEEKSADENGNVDFPLGGMWPNGQILTYCFLDPYPGTPHQQRKVKLVIKEWEKYANVRFEYVDSQDAIIRITLDSHDGSWSFIGRDITTVKPLHPTMNLAWIDDTEDICEIDKGIILHEFGHALGLRHEHQSPKRGGILDLKAAPIIEYYTTQQKWSKKEVSDQILLVYNEKQVNNYPRLDMKSIMMYFTPAAMNEQNKGIKPNNDLSDIDKAFMTINYPPDDNTNKMEWTIELALDVIGIGDRKKNQIIETYRNGGWASLRQEFAVATPITKKENVS